MNWLRGKEPWLAIAAGILAALSMPGFGLFPLVFVALIAWFISLEGGRGFSRGYLFGLAFFALDMRWILTLYRFAPLIAGGYILIVAYLAIPFGLVGGLMTWRTDHRPAWRWLLLAPALIVLAEFVRTVGPLGIGFSMLHHALYRVPLLIQSAAQFGSWSITALIVAINAALYLAWHRRSVRFAALALGLLLAQAAFWLLPTGLSRDDPTLNVAVVSSNVKQEVKLNARNLSALTERFAALGDEAAATDPDLIVFPESFLPAYILNVEPLLKRFADLARTGESQLLFGTGRYGDGEIRNSTVLVDAEGSIVGTYDMVRPVPFGEVIPGRSVFEAIGLGGFVRSFLPLDLTAGTTYNPLSGIGTPICFESTFPTGSRPLTRAGATLLVTVTNDAWFVRSSELAAHFAAAVFRAVENRRSVVQAANGGISGFVDPRGRIQASTRDETVLVERVTRSSAQSLFVRWGDGPMVLLAACIGILSLVWGWKRRRQQRSGE